MRLKLFLVMAVLSLSASTMAQRDADFGLFAGTAYYLGDINPSKHFYRSASTFSAGVFYRYNINTRYALKAGGYIARLSGSDADFPGRFNPDRPSDPAKFSTSLLDLALQVEFNFLPYKPYEGIGAYTPYISAGIGGSMIISSSSENAGTIGPSTNPGLKNPMNIPFGLGVKVNLTQRLTAGAEWSFRKSFSDYIDGIENPSGMNSLIHNNDWYSFMGIFITYKFFNFASDCPAYD